jgi:hypothetical protein
MRERLSYQDGTIAEKSLETVRKAAEIAGLK